MIVKLLQVAKHFSSRLVVLSKGGIHASGLFPCRLLGCACDAPQLWLLRSSFRSVSDALEPNMVIQQVAQSTRHMQIHHRGLICREHYIYKDILDSNPKVFDASPFNQQQQSSWTQTPPFIPITRNSLIALEIFLLKSKTCK